MKFIDEAFIQVKGGNGGNGVAAFRREKFIPKGGPSGGDGGNGGSVYGIAKKNLNTLLHYRFTKIHSAKNGSQGGGQDKYGRSGDNLYLKFPVGTLIYDNLSGELLADLKEHDDKILLAQGGEGGLGNLRFKSSINRTPRQFTLGKEGEVKNLRLELKILADVGLIGLPNSGKSTFISNISSANPKIGSYPFTTISPNLGVLIGVQNKVQIVLADIPGLIEGAANGAGLGTHFLKHIQRTKLLLHFVDISDSIIDFNIFKVDDRKLIANVETIYFELKKYDKKILDKPLWIVLNKIDLMPEKESILIKNVIKTYFKVPVFLVSSFSRKGLDNLINKIEFVFNSKKVTRNAEKDFKNDIRF